MAGSSIVGTLKVLLTAETGQYTTGLDQASKKTTQFSGQLTGFAANVSSVGKALTGILTVGALTSAASQVVSYASKISDLSAQTGLTTKTIQEMQHAAKMTGASLDNFTNAAFKLGTNLAGGSNSVVGAVERLGLSYFNLQKMSPDQQFHTIATALKGVENEQERNRLAVELFGKVAKEILPAIAQDYDKLAQSASVVGDEQIKSLDAAGDALDQFWATAKSVGVNLAGGYVLAVNKATIAYQEWLHSILNTQEAHATLAAHLQVLGLRSAVLPKVLNESTVAARNLPPALTPIAMSLSDIEAAEKKLDEQVKASIESKKKQKQELQHAHKELHNWNLEVRDQNASMSRGLSTMADFTAALEKHTDRVAHSIITQAMLRQEYDRSVAAQRVLFDNLERDAKRAMEQSEMAQRIIFANLETAAKQSRTNIGKAFQELPGVILAAIQGGGSVLGAAGAHIGTSLMSRFQEKFGPAISAALPFGIGAAINQLLPVLGSLFGPIAEKIGGFFRNIFGGPSAEEIRGRQAVAAFEAQLHSLLNQTQLNEAGNESWKKTVIAIRDAYLAAGKTEGEAMAAAERLWQSSKKGAAETQAAIDAINAVLNATKTATDTLGVSMDVTFRDRQFTITEDRVINETINRDVYVDSPMEGFAGGTLGRLGHWFGSFPTSGMATTLHGIEAVVTPAQAPAFAMDVLGSMSGGASKVSDFSGMESRLANLERLLRDQPRHLAYAVEEAMAVRGTRR